MLCESKCACLRWFQIIHCVHEFCGASLQWRLHCLNPGHKSDIYARAILMTIGAKKMRLDNKKRIFCVRIIAIDLIQILFKKVCSMENNNNTPIIINIIIMPASQITIQNENDYYYCCDDFIILNGKNGRIPLKPTAIQCVLVWWLMFMWQNA